MKKVRIGLVGSGFWVDAMYLPALQNYEYGQIVAIAGNSPISTVTLAKEYLIPEAFHGDHSWKRMIDSCELDAVIIASPTHTHYEIAKYALEAGLHVLCEKPLASTVEQAEELAYLANILGLVNMVGFTYSWLPKIVEAMDNADLYHSFNLSWTCGFMHGVKRPGDKYNKLKGNRLFADVASHMIYITNKMFGKVKSVDARIMFDLNIPKSDGFEPSESGGIVYLEYEDGAYGDIILQTDIPQPKSPYNMHHDFQFDGDQKRTRIWNCWEQRDVAEYKRVFRTTDVFARQFCRNVMNDTAATPSFDDGVNVQRTLEMIYAKVQ